MPVGKVKWFDCKKGFGFIEGDGQPDIFVHFTDIQGDDTKFRRLQDGDEVEYELIEGRKGPAATSVRLVPPRPGLADTAEPSGAVRRTLPTR